MQIFCMRCAVVSALGRPKEIVIGNRGEDEKSKKSSYRRLN